MAEKTDWEVWERIVSDCESDQKSVNVGTLKRRHAIKAISLYIEALKKVANG